MNLENIGNCLGENPEKRIVKPSGLVQTPDLIMKLYSMLPKDESVNMVAAKSFVEQKIKDYEIKPAKSGMGFVIISENALTSTVWGLGNNIVPNTIVYSHEGNFADAKKQDINTDGNYCAFEAQIFGFESKKWIEYLNSPRKISNKKQYLDAFFERLI